MVRTGYIDLLVELKVNNMVRFVYKIYCITLACTVLL